MSSFEEKYIIGFDIGGTKCAAVLGTISGVGPPRFLERQEFPTKECPQPVMCLNRLADLALGFLKEHSVPLVQITGVGVSCGGPMDRRRGIVRSPPNLPGWDEVPVTALLQQRLGLPVCLQNDANACALAEWRWGAGRDTKTCIFLTFGTGLGAGLVVDGRLYTGLDDLAGEVGHWRLAPSGPEGFGKPGSFEGFCSGGGLSRMAEASGLTGVDAQTLAQKARLGDTRAKAIFETCARRLGHGLGLLIDLLNPEVIVLGSIFSRCEDLLRPTMEIVLREEALSDALRRCRVLPSALGEQIGDFAALAAWEEG